MTRINIDERIIDELNDDIERLKKEKQYLINKLTDANHKILSSILTSCPRNQVHIDILNNLQELHND